MVGLALGARPAPLQPCRPSRRPRIESDRQPSGPSDASPIPSANRSRFVVYAAARWQILRALVALPQLPRLPRPPYLVEPPARSPPPLHHQLVSTALPIGLRRLLDLHRASDDRPALVVFHCPASGLIVIFRSL